MCPEQYDVWYEHATGDRKFLAYVRLRHGSLKLQENVGEEIWYEHTFEDEWKGGFEDEKERVAYIKDMSAILKQKYNLPSDTEIVFPEGVEEYLKEVAEGY
jgi:hypothetical protein